VYRYQLSRRAIGQRFQDHPVHNAEDGCVGANPQSQRRNGDGGESSVLIEPPQGKPQIGAKVREHVDFLSMPKNTFTAPNGSFFDRALRRPDLFSLLH
jgi:hypothetical protein